MLAIVEGRDGAYYTDVLQPDLVIYEPLSLYSTETDAYRDTDNFRARQTGDATRVPTHCDRSGIRTWRAIAATGNSIAPRQSIAFARHDRPSRRHGKRRQ